MDLRERFLAMKEHFSLNTNQLSKKAKVTRQAIANIEDGVTKDCKASLLVNIATELGVNPSWILTGEGQMVKVQDSDCEKRTVELQAQVDSLTKELQGMKLIVSALYDRLDEKGIKQQPEPAKTKATDVAGREIDLIDYLLLSKMDTAVMPSRACA